MSIITFSLTSSYLLWIYPEGFSEVFLISLIRYRQVAVSFDLRYWRWKHNLAIVPFLFGIDGWNGIWLALVRVHELHVRWETFLRFMIKNDIFPRKALTNIELLNSHGQMDKEYTIIVRNPKFYIRFFTCVKTWIIELNIYENCYWCHLNIRIRLIRRNSYPTIEYF